MNVNINRKIHDIVGNNPGTPSKYTISSDEKIDFIYTYLKKEQRNSRVRRIIKIIFWIILIGYFYITIFVLLPRILGDMIPGVDINSIRNNIFGPQGDTQSDSPSRVDMQDEF
ncbi:hypothetical protein LAT59_00415 [Candidatus Gracilibacteria bacterium]|nr:hypothetical protein [Candidatus Gracilibacteria bacterium]